MRGSFIFRMPECFSACEPWLSGVGPLSPLALFVRVFSVFLCTSVLGISINTIVSLTFPFHKGNQSVYHSKDPLRFCEERIGYLSPYSTKPDGSLISPDPHIFALQRPIAPPPSESYPVSQAPATGLIKSNFSARSFSLFSKNNCFKQNFPYGWTSFPVELGGGRKNQGNGARIGRIWGERKGWAGKPGLEQVLPLVTPSPPRGLPPHPSQDNQGGSPPERGRQGPRCRCRAGTIRRMQGRTPRRAPAV